MILELISSKGSTKPPSTEKFMRQAIFAVFVCLFPTLTIGQVTFPQVTQPVATFSSEDKDWGIEATTTPTTPPYHARTPTSIPGARVIKTLELKALLESNKQVVVIDVLDSGTRTSIPGAFWMFGAGDDIFFAAENRRFATALEKLMGGTRTGQSSSFASAPSAGSPTTPRCMRSKPDTKT